MKKTYQLLFIIIPVIICCHQRTHAQTPTNAISKSAFDSLVRKGFTQIVTGQNDVPSLANYASFNPTDGKFSFNAFKLLGNCAAASITAAGGLLNDNIGVLFDGGKINTNTDLNLKLHFRLDKPNIQYDLKDAILLEQQRKRLRYKRDAEIRATNIRLDTIEVQLRRIEAQQQVSRGKADQLTRDVALWIHRKDSCMQLSDTACALSFKDSITLTAANIKTEEEKIRQLQDKKDSLAFITMLDNSDPNLQAIFGLGVQSYRDKLADKITKDYDKQIEKLEMNIPIPAWNMTWITLIGNWNNKSYRVYDSTQSLAKHIKPQRMDAFNFGVEFNWFHYDLPFQRSFLLNTGIMHKNSSNLEDLTTSKVTDVQSLSNEIYKRTISTDYNAYTEPVEKFSLWNPYANFYYLFGKEVSTGIHLFTDAELRDNDQQLLNAGGGFIYGFNNSKANRVLNVELYLRFNDLTNTLEEEKSRLWDHAQIGISLALPFVIFKN